MAAIDRLDIEISASATNAEQSIDRLVSKLDMLSQSLGGLNTSSIANFSNAMKTLSGAMSQFKDTNVTASTFSAVAEGVNKLTAIDAARLSQLGNSLTTFMTNLQELNGVTINSQGLTEIIAAISRLGGKTATTAAANLPILSQHLKQFITDMNGVQNVTFDVSSLSTLILGISKLGHKTATQAAANLPIISKHLKQFITDLNGIGALNFDMTNLSALVTAISKLGGAASGRAVNNIPALGQAIKGLFTTLATAPNVSQNIVSMTSALASLAGTGASGNKAMSNLGKGMENYGSSADKAKKKTFNLTSAIGSFYAKCFLAIRAVKTFANAVKSTSDYIEAFNYFAVAFNRVGEDWGHQFEKYGYENAESYAKSFADRMNAEFKKLSGISFDTDNMRLAGNEIKNLGLNIKEVTQYASELAGVFNSADLSGEVTYAASDALTKLAGDYSSLINVDYETAAQNFRSGITGQSRVLYKYGIDVTDARLKAEAYALGISKSTTEMTQAEKMQLRLIAILKQSKIAWGDLANTINQPANQMRVLKTQISELSMLFGQLFVPILSKVIPVITGVVIALKRLMSTIAQFMGVKLGDADAYKMNFDNISAGAEDLSENLDDVTKSAEKAQKGIRGFDELNVINTSKDSADSDSGGGVDLTDEILAMTEEYQKAWEEAYNRMQSNAENVADKVGAAFERVSTAAKNTATLFMNGFKASVDTTSLETAQQRLAGVGTQLKTIFTNEQVQTSANTFFKEFVYDLGRITADVVNIGVSVASGFVGGIEQYLTDNSERITTYITNMFNIGTIISESVANISDSLADIFKVFEGENFVNLVDNFLTILLNPFMSVSEIIGKSISSWLQGLELIITENSENLKLALDNFFGVLDAWIKPIADSLTALGDKWNEVFDVHIQPAIERISGSISKLTDTILNLYNNYVAPFLKETGEMFGELMEKYITPAIGDILEFGGQFTEFISLMWERIEPRVKIIAETLFPMIINAAERLRNTFMFLFEGIGVAIKTVTTILTGFAEFVLGVLTGDLERAGKGIEKIFKGIGNHIVGIFESALNFIIRQLNTLRIDVPQWVPGIGGERFGFNLKTVKIPRLENGGILPRSADLFYANENGVPELVGTMGGKTAVASGTEITGIADAVYTTGQTEAGLLQTAVGLLEVIAEKEYGISSDAIFKSVQKSARTYSQRTGKLAFGQ